MIVSGLLDGKESELRATSLKLNREYFRKAYWALPGTHVS